MSDTLAIATKPFLGAPDGDPYPQAFEKGDAVSGDLADVAIGEAWARAAEDEAAFTAGVAARAKRLAPSADA